MYNVNYYTVNLQEIISFTFQNGAKMRIVGEGWFTPWFVFQENAEVPVLSVDHSNPPGVSVTCEERGGENQAIVHFAHPDCYSGFVVYETDGTSVEGVLVELKEGIAGYAEIFGEIIGQINDKTTTIRDGLNNVNTALAQTNSLLQQILDAQSGE